MRKLEFLVGAVLVGCAAPAAKRVETTPAARVEWLRAEYARAELLDQHLRGAYLPRAIPGGSSMVCSMAIEINAWYGFADERWELTNADVEQAETSDVMPWMSTTRASSNMREEMARIGIRNCILDMNNR